MSDNIMDKESESNRLMQNSTTLVHQENESAIKPEQNGLLVPSSSTKWTRHVNVRYPFVTA